MPRTAFLFFAVLLLATAGCHGVSVDSTSDPDVDWSQLHTYDWLSVPLTSPTAVKETTLIGVLTETLTQKGLQRNQEKPDLLIAVHRTIEGTLNTKGSGYEVRDGRLRSYALQAGSLVIDMIKPATKETVWRGTASGAFRADFMPAERRAFLVDLMNDMFADFPPKR